jgi:hypothetical protein
LSPRSNWREGNTPQQIANVRGLKVSTIYTHLADAIEGGRLQASDVLTLLDAEIVAIQEAILALPEGGRLYPQIRWAVCWKVRLRLPALCAGDDACECLHARSE